ncbi:MAG: CapA family protein [Saprospiraceae bacterium]|nr:MAG: CapA family protein [Saprospiraceae bacterium]
MPLKRYFKDLLIGGLFFALAFSTFPATLDAQTDTLVSVTGVGDIMMGTNYPSRNYLPPNGGDGLLSDVDSILSSADVTFGNLEGTLFDGEGTAKRCRDTTKCYIFRTPASYVKHLYDAGFDVISIANNHSGDFGNEGRIGTKAVLKNAGIAFAGLTGTGETATFERNGTTFGFCAFAPNSGTCDIRDTTKAKQIVASLEHQCDIVIVSFHGGAEGSGFQHVPKTTETFLGENRGDVYNFAHAVIDAGADIVFGHGPHVTRAVELYKDRFIAYSLGNFFTYSRISLAGVSGLAPIVKVVTDEKGAFVSGEITATYQVKGHGPRIDPQKRVIAKIRELTASDFPDSGLLISEEGKIEKGF